MQFLLESSFEAINSGLDKISQVSKIGNSPNASTFQGKFGDIVPYTMETCYNSDFSCVFFLLLLSGVSVNITVAKKLST
jgi:hypothetical protein